MVFINNTPFPSTTWSSLDKDSTEFDSVVVRVKYLFDKMDKNGLWSLKLASSQDELFVKDEFYENNLDASVKYESDYVPYKPHADLVLNSFSYSKKEKRSWLCGVKVLRKNSNTNEEVVLIDKKLKLYGKRYWTNKVIAWGKTRPEPTKKISLRYENAYGGFVKNPKYEKKNNQKEYLVFYDYNPVGKGRYSRKYKKKNDMPLPQIEKEDEPIKNPFKGEYFPQGFGFIHRSWKSRRFLAGTFDDEWLKTKSPIMPDDFQEEFNNAAHPDLQYKDGYFKGKDIIYLNNLLPGISIQSFKIPNFYFKAEVHIQDKNLPFYLDIDTVLVDIENEDIEENAIYVSYRKRIKHDPKVEKLSLHMLVPKDFIDNQAE